MIATFDKVVIDSGPLFTLLTLHYAMRTKRVSLLQKIDVDIRRSVSMQRACLELFRSIRCILTTSHVIGAIRNNISTIGPTDAGLIELALREGCMLLTDDQRTLAPLAYRLGVDCGIFKTMLK